MGFCEEGGLYILSPVSCSSGSVKWDDIAGLQQAKNTLTEMVLLPTLRGVRGCPIPHLHSQSSILSNNVFHCADHLTFKFR